MFDYFLVIVSQTRPQQCNSAEQPGGGGGLCHNGQEPVIASPVILNTKWKSQTEQLFSLLLGLAIVPYQWMRWDGWMPMRPPPGQTFVVLANSDREATVYRLLLA